MGDKCPKCGPIWPCAQHAITPEAKHICELAAQVSILTDERDSAHDHIADVLTPEIAELKARCEKAEAELARVREALGGTLAMLDLIEQDEGITACQCLSQAPDDISAPPPCEYCIGKATLEGKP